MGPLDEIASEQFARWEQRGRGWTVYPNPVSPEPPFRPFIQYSLPEPNPDIDDGWKPTILSSLFDSIHRKLNPKPPRISAEPEEEPEPLPLERQPLLEIQAMLPAKFDASNETCIHFFQSLSLCEEPVVFELLAMHERVTPQFAASVDDAPLLQRQLQSHFAEALFVERKDSLLSQWETCEGDDFIVVEFGLAREFMLPLARIKNDPFVGIIGALSALGPDEFAALQITFQPVGNPWHESIVRSVHGNDTRPLFVNRPELVKAAEEKAAQFLGAAVMRLAVRTAAYERTLQVARDIAGALVVFQNPQGNELIPLSNAEYPPEDHVADFLTRQSRRTGMLLTGEELAGFVHLPTTEVQSPALVRESGKTRPAPLSVRQRGGILLGENVHAGESVSVSLSPEQRVRHCHIIGASGTGKSTLLFNLIAQDIRNGQGLAVLDPHGDLIDKVLGIIPPERIGDVVLVDPADEEYSIGLNILSAHSDLEQNLLSSDLVAVFQRLSTSWGDQLNSVLQKAIHVYLESSERGTLSDLRRFLIEPAYRAEFLKTVRDPELLYYWQKAFPQLTGNRSIGPVITRIDAFLAPKPIRHMVSQTENRLDFGEIMDSGKIFLAKLPEGLLGKENSYLLGTLLVSKFQQLAMTRQAKQIATRRDFWMYIDEFHNFISPSMAEILAGARKYRIGLTLAHQELHQLERNRDVASAVMSNPYTRIVFRVGDNDSKRIADGFAFFESRDLQNLETGQAICRVERADNDFNLTVSLPDAVDAAQAKATSNAAIAASRTRYATPRADVESALLKKFQSQEIEAKGVKSKTALPKPPKAEKVIAEEPPNSTVSKEEISLSVTKPTATPEVEPRINMPPPDLGKGGAQHKAIQQRLKEAAEQCGFYAVIEKEIPNGSVDLFVERAGHAIACEISVTTTIDHEVGNAQKCLRAGFDHVAVICQDETRLRKIENAIATSLGPDLSKKVEFFKPDDFSDHLKVLAAELAQEQPAPVPDANRKRVRRGWQVSTTSNQLSSDERKAREKVTISQLAALMQRKA